MAGAVVTLEMGQPEHSPLRRQIQAGVVPVGRQQETFQTRTVETADPYNLAQINLLTLLQIMEQQEDLDLLGLAFHF